MQVPLLDLKAQYAIIREEIIPAVQAVLESQIFNIGPAVKELEKTIADYCGCKAAVGVSSGTDALLLSMMALGVGSGDEVITTPFTFFATAGAIWRLGAKPRFVDIKLDTFNIDSSKIEAAVTENTRAVMLVHLYGQMAEMDEIMDVAGRHGLCVIEDAAQAIGAEYKGRKAGSIGTAGVFSFYPTKNLGAMGDAGMIVTQDEQLAEKMQLLRNHGMGRQYSHKWVGGNFRMDSVQAAALMVKMRYLTGWTEQRRANAARYDSLLADCDEVAAPVVSAGRFAIYNQYVIRAAGRDELRKYLADNGIASGVYYPLGLHMQECFASLGFKEGDFPVAEKACREVLALPVHQDLADEQIDYVAGKIKAFYA